MSGPRRYNYKGAKELVVHNNNHAMVGVVPCSGNKVDSCSDVKFPIDTNPSNYGASKAAARAAANNAAKTGNYYETNFLSGGSLCSGVDSKTDCEYFGMFGDCWDVEYHLRSEGVHCD
tara:strand:- start:122 stop:475 length:354 start_codon:yes stop_codon:yes gene_type:complete